MIKVKITVPQGKNHWKAVFGKGHPLTRIKVVSLYRLLESKMKRFVSTESDPTLAVCVNYGHGYRNEGDYSTFAEFFFALTAFLEDYLPAGFRRSREKKYLPV